MKTLLKFYFLFPILALNAQTPSFMMPQKSFFSTADKISIKLKINNAEKTLECSKDTLAKIYICPNENNPILVKKNDSGFTALGKENNSIKLFNLSRAAANEKVLFEVPKIEILKNFTEGQPDSAKDLKSDMNQKILIIDSFFDTNPYGVSGVQLERARGSENYERIAKPLVQEKDRLKEELDLISQNKNYKIELEDGQAIHCERETTRNLTLKEISNLRIGQSSVQCGSFKCDNVKIDNKNYKATLIYNSDADSYATPTIHLFDDKGIGPRISVKKVFAEQSPTPFKDNTFDNSAINYEGIKYLDALPIGIKDDREKISVYTNPLTSELIYYYQGVCADNSPYLNALVLAKKELMAPMAQLDLVEFIQVLGSGSLISEFIDPTKAASMGCFTNGVYLNPEAEKNINLIKKNLRPDNNVKQTVSLELAMKLFNQAKKMKDIPWNYKQDGCYARAHLMARRFEAQGVRVDKVWIKGLLSVPETGIRWNFHVAPILYVHDSKGKIQKMVIDPSLFDKPVTVEEWDNKMTKATVRGSVRTSFPFPENAAVMERAAITFSSSSPYLPKDKIIMTEEEKITLANETMKKYREAQ
jgi:hypothetical protein